MAADTLTSPVIAGTSNRSNIYHNFIDGEWVEASTGQTFENRNPADTRDVVGIFLEHDSDPRAEGQFFRVESGALFVALSGLDPQPGCLVPAQGKRFLGTVFPNDERHLLRIDLDDLTEHPVRKRRPHKSQCGA